MHPTRGVMRLPRRFASRNDREKSFLKYLLQWEKKWGKIGLRIYVCTCILRHIFNKWLWKEGNKLFKKPMKMRDLEVWGVPSYIVDIWEKNYSSHLMSVQEKAVRYYDVLDYGGRKGMDSRLRGCVTITSFAYN